MSAPAKYRKKPVVIEAMQFDGKNLAEVAAFMGETPPNEELAPGLFIIKTLEGKLAAGPGDWIICGVVGEFYPCKADYFAATYEPAASPTRLISPPVMVGCPDCASRIEAFRRHDEYRLSRIRRVLECHALGAQVIALKDAKYERLEALHALEALAFIEKRLIALGAIPNAGSLTPERQELNCWSTPYPNPFHTTMTVDPEEESE